MGKQEKDKTELEKPDMTEMSTLEDNALKKKGTIHRNEIAGERKVRFQKNYLRKLWDRV